MPEQVLVTGASGFVGQRLVAALRSHGHAVGGFSIEDGEIARAELPFDGVRHGFDLAARVFVPESWAAPPPFDEVNVLGTVNVLEFCRKGKAALTLVSSYIYGAPQRLPVAEDHPVEAFNSYCETKIIAEQVCRLCHRVFDVPVTVVRPFNLCGPGQDAFQVVDKRPRRDHLHVSDLVSLLLRTILVGILNRVTGRPKPLLSEDRQRPQEVMEVYADISRARRELGWEPRVPFEQGLRDLLEFTHASTGSRHS